MVKRRRAGDATKAIGYVRVSTEEQSLGPDAQRASLALWCRSHGVELVAVFEDRLSGATALGDRPGLGAALAAIGEHGAGLFVSAKRDRLARDFVLVAAIERAVTSAGAAVRTCDGSSDAIGPEGKMMRGIIDVFGAYERDLIRSRTKAALATKKAKGERVGQVPYGFDVADDGVSLTANASEQAVIELVRELASKGKSQRAICAQLTERGLRNRAGGEWAQTSIARMLKSASSAA